MLSGHQHAPLERIRAQEIALLVQDTTVLDYGTPQPQAGMGTVTIKGRDEYLLPPTVAFTPERVNLGVLGARWWQRPEPPGGRERQRKPIEAQESYRWLAGDALACEVKQACPQTLVVTVAAREGEIHEWVLDALRRPAGERAACLLRAKGNRRLTKGPTHRYLWADLQGTRPLGTMTIELTRPPDRVPRQVTGAVAVQRVTFDQARRLGGTLPPVAVTAVYATECQPPRGEEPIAWLRLTSLPVAAFPRACTVVPWSRCRWEMEPLCRVRKQGCQSEP
jgi:hypothetical protein